MATFYSEHFATPSSATAMPPTSLNGMVVKAPPGQNAATILHKVTHFDFTASAFADDDTFLCFPMKSSDRLLSCQLSTAVAWDSTLSTITMDLGVFLQGANHDGAAIEAALFMTTNTLETAKVDQDAWGNGTSAIVDGNKGRALWEIVNVETAATYAKDPQEVWDVVGTFHVGNVDAVPSLLRINIAYTPGGTS